jgi:flagellar biosynthesis regulator FlaF
LDTVLGPDAAKATAQAFAVLTHTIDLMDAQRAAARQFVNLLGATCLIIALGVAVAYL